MTSRTPFHGSTGCGGFQRSSFNRRRGERDAAEKIAAVPLPSRAPSPPLDRGRPAPQSLEQCMSDRASTDAEKHASPSTA